MSICDNCIHLNVCGHEGVEDEAMTYCADKEERPTGCGNIIEDDSLIRSRPIECGGALVAIEKQLIITKEEFLACYNKWVKGEE